MSAVTTDRMVEAPLCPTYEPPSPPPEKSQLHLPTPGIEDEPENPPVDLRSSVVFDSNSPYYVRFNRTNAADAVYMVSQDPLFGPVLAVVYRDQSQRRKGQKDSGICAMLISSHGTSGFINITMNARSRYFSATQNLSEDHRSSIVRRALAMASLRSFATMDSVIRSALINAEIENNSASGSKDKAVFDWDETAAGALASRFQLADGKYPREIGQAIADAGVIEPKYIRATAVDVVYEDNDDTIDQNNELVFLLGEQLEQLFDPLTEYSPEHAERLYVPPAQAESYATLQDDPELVRSICEELYLVQSHMRMDLMDFLHEFLIPLRVQVLGEEAAQDAGDDVSAAQKRQSMTIRKLNTIFPPTIDEVVRINNLFYDALKQALPFGSFEVLKACGTTIPYFYKACMRHEAATKNLARNLNYHLASIQARCPSSEAAQKYTTRRIESILLCGLHLTKIKLILDRLVKSKEWAPQEQNRVNEYHQLAVGTIGAFGKQQQVAPYERLVFTPTGKLLVEIASGWPKELEYGWLNRRVVTIFDAVNIMSPSQRRKDVHHIVILFTDSILMVEPSEPIPMVSTSGLHVPSVADQLMHSMLNEVPLQNLPKLKVIAWAPISNIHVSEYNSSRSLAIFATGDGFTSGMNLDDPTSPAPAHGRKHNLALYQLIRPDHQNATKIVELVAKAKITNKTEPFHLFKTTRPKMLLYTTVHELQGYINESRKLPVGVFLNLTASEATLKTHKLAALVNVEVVDDESVRLTTISHMGYSVKKVVHKSNFAESLSMEVTYLMSLFLSSANQEMTDCIVNTNRQITDYLINYATTPLHGSEATGSTREQLVSKPVGHKRGVVLPPKSPTVAFHEAEERAEEPEEFLDADAQSAEKRRISPVKFIRQKMMKSSEPSGMRMTDDNIQKKKSFKFLRGIREKPEASAMVPVPMSPVSPVSAGTITAQDTYTVETRRRVTDPIVKSPGPGAVGSPALSPDRESVNSQLSPRPRSISSPAQQVKDQRKVFEQLSTYRRGGNIASDDEDYLDDWEDMASDGISIASSKDTGADLAEQQQQRDVDEWYRGIEGESDGDLDSYDPGFDEDEPSDAELDIQQMVQGQRDSIQLTKFLDPMMKDIYNNHARQSSYAQIRQADDEVVGVKAHRAADSVSTVQPDITYASSGEDTVDTINFEEDFSYLAGLVGDEDTRTEVVGELPNSESRRLHPDLRDSSIIFLGSYVRSHESSSLGSIASVQIKQEESVPSITGLRHSGSLRSGKSGIFNGRYFDDRDSSYYYDHSYSNSGRFLASKASVSELAVPTQMSGSSDLSPVTRSTIRAAHGINRRQPSLEMQFKFPLSGEEPTVVSSSSPLREVRDRSASNSTTGRPPVISQSFRRMINDSSVNTLQLASFTVQVDRLIEQKQNTPAISDELRNTKRTVMELYEKARVPVSDSSIAAASERMVRPVVASTLWVVLSLMERDPSLSTRYVDIFQALLDMEWLRRNKLQDQNRSGIDLWPM